MSTSFKPELDFPVAVAIGAIKGVSDYANIGIAENLTADTDTDLTNLGLTIPLPLNAGEALEILSDNALDVDTIRITALGPNGVDLDPIEVVLTGITPVALPGLISRINSARSVGIPGFIGDIDIRQSGGGTVFGRLDPRHQVLVQSHCTIPANKFFTAQSLIGTMQKSLGTDTDVILTLLAKQFFQERYSLLFAFGLQRSGTSSTPFVNSYPEGAVSPFDLKIQARSSATGTSVLARVNGLTIDR